MVYKIDSLQNCLINSEKKAWETNTEKNVLQSVSWIVTFKMTFLFTSKLQTLLKSLWNAMHKFLMLEFWLCPQSCSSSFIHLSYAFCSWRFLFVQNIFFWHFTNPKQIEETGHVIPVSPGIWRVSDSDAVLHCS